MSALADATAGRSPVNIHSERLRAFHTRTTEIQMKIKTRVHAGPTDYFPYN
jgi:hypothetical protein